MFKTVRILVPTIPSNQDFYLKGYIDTSEPDLLTIYFTRFSSNKLILDNKNELNIIYGHLQYQKKGFCLKHNLINHIILQYFEHEDISIEKLVLGDTLINIHNSIIMIYEYDKFKESELVFDSNDCFSKLKELVQYENGQEIFDSIKGTQSTKANWLESSMFFQHVLNYLHLIKWLFNSVKKNKKVTIKQGNLILAILVDILIGFLVLTLMQDDKKVLSATLMEVLEKLVNSLYSLLKWLMGAPAGLKLNNAFNKMLGKYFSYHIHLWWLFLEVSGEKLDTILQIYHYIGYLGFTFQAAIISDMICIATFHAYCIYVYAARLFNIQVSGLIALLRLFVGRKYNPLRGGIDSCEYTNQELFVGTVAFTILLLLLPTTAMYYIVFTLLRLLSLLVQHILAKFIYIIQTLPLYVISLWLTHSPKVAGHIIMEVVKTKSALSLILRVKLLRKPIHLLVNTFKPPVEVPQRVELTYLLSNIFIGKQLV